MSFSDLKAKKHSKSSHSYVTSATAPSSSTTTLEAASESPRDHETLALEAVSIDGLYGSLSPSIVVKRSEKHGRGLWVSEAGSPGTSSPLKEESVSLLNV